MGAYNFKGVVDKEKVFVINYSEISERIDPIYFKSVNDLLIVKNTSNPVFKLSEVVNMKRGRFGHRPRNDPKFYNGKYPFIQTGDVVKASKSGKQIPYSQTLNELGLKTSRLFKKKSIVMTIAANIGDTAVLDYPACFPDSLIAIQPKDEKTLQLEYLNVYLKFVKKYLNNLAPQAAQKNINYQQLAPTPIVVPSIQHQQKIIALYKKAYLTKQQKEKEAQELLASIDAYLLDALGITLPEKDDRLESRIFTVNFSEVSGERFDSEYFQLYYKNIINAVNSSIYPLSKIKEITSFIESGGRPKGGVNQIESGVFSLGGEHVNNKCEVGHGKPKYIPLDFHKKALNTETKLNDIILVKDGATTGKIGIINSDQFTGCNINEHVFIIRTILNIANPYYLTFFLHTIIGQKLIQREITGATVTGLTKDSLRKIEIPLPPLQKQNEIAKHISEIRARAKELQAEAKAGLEQAKAEIEQLILGE